ncbi:hypothetical protein BH24ACT3_BH24ACT3_10800 [soil metagenome]
MADRLLRAVAGDPPTGPDNLGALGDLGPVKAARYGPALVTLVAELADASPVASGAAAE